MRWTVAICILAVVTLLAGCPVNRPYVDVTDIPIAEILLDVVKVVPEIGDPCEVPKDDFTEIVACSANEECPTGWCIRLAGSVEKEGVCALRTDHCPEGWAPQLLWVDWDDNYNTCQKNHCIPELNPADMICAPCGFNGCGLQLESVEEYPNLFGKVYGDCVLEDEFLSFCSIACDEDNPCPSGFECSDMWSPDEGHYDWYCRATEGCLEESEKPGTPGSSCTEHSDCYSGWCLLDPASETEQGFCLRYCWNSDDCGPPDGNYMCRAVDMWNEIYLCVPKKGWPCGLDSGCPDELVCHESYGSGQCWPPSKEGEACKYSDDCEEGLICDHGKEPPVCQQGIPGSPGTPCKEYSECQEGLVCNEWYDPPLCIPPAGLGEQCSETTECAAGLICSFAFDPPECRQPGQVGDACASTEECAEGLSCNTAYYPDQCRPLGKEGDLCNDQSDCEENLLCNTAYQPNQCRPLGEWGDKCQKSYECIAGLTCNFGYSPTQCQPYSEEGGPCMYHTDCGWGLKCDKDQSPPVCTNKEM